MSEYFLKPSERFDGYISVKLDLCNYATKADLKRVAGFDTSNLPAKSDLAGLKAGIDKINILKTVLVYLGKLSNVVNKVNYV